MGRKAMPHICRICGRPQDQPHQAGWCREHMLEDKRRKEHERREALRAAGKPVTHKRVHVSNLFPGVDHSREWAGIPLKDEVCRQKRCGIPRNDGDYDRYSLVGTGRTISGGKC